MSSPDTDTLIARLRAAGCVFAEDEAALLQAAATDPAHLESLVAQRIAGFPLEHLLGWTEFRGLRVAVAPGVFVPRQRTAFLVEQAIALARAKSDSRGDHPRHSGMLLARIHTVGVDPGQEHAGMTRDGGPDAAGGAGNGARGTAGRPLVALDLCCGCGALGLAFVKELSAEGISVDLIAADIEPAAVGCARTNLEAVGGRVFEGDLFEAVPAELAGRVDVLLANTPYVPSGEIAGMPPEARDHEPRRALDGGVDGLDVLRRIAAVAGEWLAPGGHLLVEESEGQAAAAVAIMTGHGLVARVAECAEMGATVVIGTRA
ncbi:methyltransferase [Nocardia yunnanensis]